MLSGADLVAGCQLCAGNEAVAAGDAPSRERVLVTDFWRVLAHKSALPGWMLVVARSHVRSLADLTESEAAELGMILRQGTVAVVQEFDAVKSYVMQFSEGMEGHLHFSLAPRLEGLPTDRRGAAISAYNSQDPPIDDEARDEVANRLRRAWPVQDRSIP